MRRNTLQRYERTVGQPHLSLPLLPPLGSVPGCRMVNVFKGFVPLPPTARSIPIIFGRSKDILPFLRNTADL
jgi:hypothetical protein